MTVCVSVLTYRYISIAHLLLLQRPVYNDVPLKLLSEAGSVRSAGELVGDVRELVMTNRVLIVYLVPLFLFGLSKNEKPF